MISIQILFDIVFEREKIRTREKTCKQFELCEPGITLWSAHILTNIDCGRCTALRIEDTRSATETMRENRKNPVLLSTVWK